MRMYYGVNTTALLVDSSIHAEHFTEPDRGSIFSFEQALGSLIAYTTPADATNHPVFIIQFDENQHGIVIPGVVMEDVMALIL